MNYRRRYFNAPRVPCPECISRAQWIPVDHTDANAIPSDVKWFEATPEMTRLLAVKTGATQVWFNAANPDTATLRRMYRGECDATVFSRRDPRHINTARKGEVCNACADLVEGAW